MKNLNFIIENTYPDIVSSICIPLIISILAIALPLLSGDRQQIESKYSSGKIVECFEKSHTYRSFYNSLYLALISIVLWVFRRPRLEFNNEYINRLIENSAWILLLIATIVLVVYLFFYIFYLRKYNNPFELFRRLEKQHNKQSDEEKKKLYFEAISDLFYYSIQKPNEELRRSIISFLGRCFESKRKDKKNEEIVYPSEYYELIYKANGYINIREKEASSIFNGAIMFGFLVGIRDNPSLSSKSYEYIWESIHQSIFYKDDKMIFSYWKKAHHHLSSNLNIINVQFGENRTKINEKEVEKRDKERKKFKEFHYALGALMLHSKRYSLLEKCLSYTSSDPPSYYLVPNIFHCLFEDYIALTDDYDEPHYYNRYSFPDISGVNRNSIVFMWINRYFAILFLRQYGVYYYNNNKPTLPNLPKTPVELTTWQKRIETLKTHTEYYITEKPKVLDKLNISYLLNSELLEKKEQEAPLKFLELSIQKIKDEYDGIKKEQLLSKDKVEMFKDKSVEKIKEAYNQYEKVTSEEDIEDVKTPIEIYIGVPKYNVLPKGAFAENQDIGYSGFDSITAESIVSKMQEYFAVSFFSVVSTKYTLHVEDLFKAIDKLNIQDKNKYIIISIDIDISDQINNNRSSKLIEENGKYYYDSIEIVELGYSQSDFVNNSFFVLKRTDLPSLIKHDLDEGIINKYNLDEGIINKYKFDLSDEEYKIYTKIIDLNTEPSLKEKIAKEYSGKINLDESVLACVGISCELRWSKEAKAIQIQIYNSYQQDGSINNIKDIQSI